ALAQFRIQKCAGAPLRFSASNEGRTQQHSGLRQRQRTYRELQQQESRADQWILAESGAQRHVKGSFVIAEFSRWIQHLPENSLYFGAQALQIRNNDAN